MTSPVGTAFVAVRPDLSAFSNQLKADLKRSIGEIPIASRTIQLNPTIAKKALTEAIAAMGPIPVVVAPVAPKGTAAELAKQIGVVSVPVVFEGAKGAKVPAGGAGAAATSAPVVAQPKVDTAAAKTALTSDMASLGPIPFFAKPFIADEEAARKSLISDLVRLGPLPFFAAPKIHEKTAIDQLAIQLGKINPPLEVIPFINTAEAKIKLERELAALATSVPVQPTATPPAATKGKAKATAAAAGAVAEVTPTIDPVAAKASLEQDLLKLGVIPFRAEPVVLANSKALLAEQLAAQGAIPVVIAPDVAPAAKGKAAKAAATTTVEVIPTLAGNAKAVLQEQVTNLKEIFFVAGPALIKQAKALLTEQLAAVGPVPFEAVPVVDQTKATADIKSKVGTVAVPVTTVAAAEGVAAPAAKRASRAAGAVIDQGDLSLRVLKVTEDLKLATTELAAGELILTEALAAQKLARTDLAAAEASGEKNRIRAAASTNTLADKAVADATKQAEGLRVIDAQAKTAAQDLAKLSGVQKVVNQSLAESTPIQINAANAEDLLRKNRAATSAVNRAYGAAVTAANAPLAEQIDLQRSLLVAEEARIRGSAGLIAAQGLSAGVGVGPESTGPLAKAELTLAQASEASEEAVKARTAAQASGNVELIRSTESLAVHTAALKRDAEAELLRLQTQKLQTPVLTRLAQIELAINAANDTSASSAARVTAAGRAHTLAADAVVRYGGAVSGASAQQVKQLITLEASTASLLEDTKALNANSIAAAKNAKAVAADAAARNTLTAQAGRGAAATGATFLGLRGAVLSASTGFLAATVAVTGIAKIVKTAEDLTRELNIFQSISGATAAQMDLVSEKAKELGADLTLPATSATDAAEAMTELQKAGLSLNDTLGASKGVLQLAAAADLGNVEAAKIVATQLNAFRLAGSEAGRIVDLLAGASIAAQGEISDFALAFQQVAAVAAQVGLPVEKATAILTQFAKAGIRSSDAGTSLRTLLLRLVPTTTAAAEAQAELGISLDRSIPIGEQFNDLVDQYTRSLAKLGPVAQQEALTKIFGQDAIRGASVTLTAGSAALVKVEEAVTEAGTAAELTRGRTEGLTGSVSGLKSNVSTLSATIGEQLLPTLDSLAHTFSTIATNANSVAGILTKISNVTIKPVGNLLGGTDALAQGGVALAAALGARSLFRRRADKIATAEINKGLLGLKQRATELGASEQDLINLFQVMGITGEDAARRIASAQAEATTATKLHNDELKRGLRLAEERLIATTNASGSRFIAGAGGTVDTGTTTAAASAAQAKATADINKQRSADAKNSSQRLANSKKIAAAVATEATVIAKSTSTEIVLYNKAHAAKLNQVSGFGKVNKAAVEAEKVQTAAIGGVVAALGVQTKALFGVAAAYGRVAGASVAAAATSIRGFGKIRGALGKISGSSVSGTGLGIGIGATIAGEAIGGDAGGVLSSAGTGATFGSFLGAPGAAAGGAAFGLLELIQTSKKRAKERQEKAKAEFQKLTGPEQIELLRRLFPDQAGAFAGESDVEILELLARTAVKPGDATPRLARGPRRRPEIDSAADFVNARGGLDPQLQKIFDFQKKKRAADLELVFGKSTEPRAQLDELIAAQEKFGSEAIKKMQEAFGKSLTAKPIVIKPPTIEINKSTVAANKRALAELEEATTGSTAKLEGIAQKDVNEKQSLIQRLQSRLANLKVNGPPSLEKVLAYIQAQTVLTEKITAAAKDLAKRINTLNSIQLAKIQSTSFQVEIGGLNAQLTDTLSDDLANAQKAVAEEEAKAATTPTAKEERAKKIAQARVTEKNIQDQIDAKAKSDAGEVKTKATDAAKIRIDNLQFLADKAGNIGKAEDNLLAALQQQVFKAKANTAEFNTARSALYAEQQKAAQAVLASQQLTFDLLQSGIEARRSAAELTDTKADNVLVDRAEIRLIDRELKAAQIARDKAGQGTAAWKRAQIEVNGLIGRKNAAIAALKEDLGQGSGGFSLEDLFKESLSQFNQFASNVSTSVTTPGGVRGAIGGAIAAQNPNLTKADSLKIAAATTTNDLLGQILGVVSANGSGSDAPNMIDERNIRPTRVSGVGHWTKAQATAWAKVRTN